MRKGKVDFSFLCAGQHVYSELVCLVTVILDYEERISGDRFLPEKLKNVMNGVS